ncbi:MAG: adenine phosphoribosyltransferase [Alphaproteobacteria bacterium]|nr:adenine phosphoribosyltransferase [Alphaproteobacteria bacterium]
MIENIKKYIRNVPDFPKAGINFKDITTALKDKNVFREIIDDMYEKIKNRNIDKIAAIESRGFLFGAPLAYKLGCGLVLIRKQGKLPTKTFSQSYDLEYGSATIEIHQDAIRENENVLVIDDLLATGGTAEAACKLVKKINANVDSIMFLIELDELQGKKRLENFGEVISLIHY